MAAKRTLRREINARFQLCAVDLLARARAGKYKFPVCARPAYVVSNYVPTMCIADATYMRDTIAASSLNNPQFAAACRREAKVRLRNGPLLITRAKGTPSLRSA